MTLAKDNGQEEEDESGGRIKNKELARKFLRHCPFGRHGKDAADSAAAALTGVMSSAGDTARRPRHYTG